MKNCGEILSVHDQRKIFYGGKNGGRLSEEFSGK